jgi:hypothetical protein
MVKDMLDFHSPLRAALSTVVEADERLHGSHANLGFEATETSYYGFNIPDAKIDGEIYFWLHPQLNTMSGGIWIWQGEKRYTLQADHFNYSNYLPFPRGDIEDYEPMPGMHIKVHVPLEHIEIRYSDAATGVRLELTLKAMAPPIGRPGGGHFTQAMVTAGTLRLNGVDHVIGGNFVRDRSWGDARSERPRDLPPATWMVGVFGADLIFHARAFDDPQAQPDWLGSPVSIERDQRFRWGYLIENGQVNQLSDCRMKRTTRGSDGISPVAFEMELVDAHGRILPLVGKVVARLAMHMWPNMFTHYCLTRWTLLGQTGWGDAQDIQYSRYIRTFSR